MKRVKSIAAVLMAVAMILAVSSFVCAEDVEKININTAPLEELIKLDRIGPKYAQRIIDYRENVEPFKTPEDIIKVKGIGPKTLEANKDRIIVE
ncbi:MAG: ComEA family DNA-binding protein [Desulfobacteraceae bacterium]|nr:ComEA family DNA-binding protein [Desulfobacteraceae bacterium]